MSLPRTSEPDPSPLAATLAAATSRRAVSTGRRRARTVGTALLLAATAAALPLPSEAQPSAPEDWPCVQALIPEVSPAVLWPVPIGEAIAGSWRQAPEIAALARRLGEAERLDETIVAAIDAFANAVPEAERRDALTRLAEGTVSVANERRSRYLDGIRRYTRQQIAIAAQIEATLNRLASLDEEAGANGESSVSGAERAEIRETLDWHARLYDRRERSIRALCERPVALEQQLAETLRELAYRLPES